MTMEIWSQKRFEEEERKQTLLSDVEFADLVAATEAVLGVRLGTIEEDAVTAEGLAAMATLLDSEELGIGTKTGRKVTILAGLTLRAGKKLRDKYRRELRELEDSFNVP